MKTFMCPHCNDRLSSDTGQEINLRGVLEGPGFVVALPFVFSAEIGNYETRIVGDCKLLEGAKVTFTCPTCRATLTAQWSEELAEIKAVDEQTGRESIVVFSRIYGRHATYLYDEAQKAVIMSCGEHRGEYLDEFSRRLNFFGA